MRNDYFVFGGWLIKLLEKNPTLTKRLGKIKHIHVETANSPVRKSEGEGLRIVFLSRINKMKGIEPALDYAPVLPLKALSLTFMVPWLTKIPVIVDRMDPCPRVCCRWKNRIYNTF